MENWEHLFLLIVCVMKYNDFYHLFKYKSKYNASFSRVLKIIFNSVQSFLKILPTCSKIFFCKLHWGILGPKL